MFKTIFNFSILVQPTIKVLIHYLKVVCSPNCPDLIPGLGHLPLRLLPASKALLHLDPPALFHPPRYKPSSSQTRPYIIYNPVPSFSNSHFLHNTFGHSYTN